MSKDQYIIEKIQWKISKSLRFLWIDVSKEFSLWEYEYVRTNIED